MGGYPLMSLVKTHWYPARTMEHNYYNL